MRDLQKMREEFEKKYKLQEMANNLEEKYGTGIEFYIFERHPKHGGYRISAHDGRGLRNKPISLSHARALLVDFPADKEQILNDTASGQKEPVYGLYRVCANRGYSDIFTELSVSWLSGGNEYNFTQQIDGNELLEPFFNESKRAMCDSERTTYRPHHGNTLINEMDLPIRRFKCSHISYSGGHLSATDLDAINDIIETIRNSHDND